MARRSALAAAALVPALLAPAAPAAADVVTTLADSGPGSLRAAIASTTAGGTVTFDVQGTILLTDQLVIDKDLTIDGPGARKLAISGNDANRVLHVFDAGTEVRIDDVTVRDGRAVGDEALGAGVLLTGGDLVRLTRVAVLGNDVASTTRVPFGGGIAAVSGRVELIDTTVADNHATGGGGGGVFAGVPATFEIVNSTIEGNSAAGGAGLLSLDSAGLVQGSTIARNTADNVGGGIGASPTAAVTVQRSLVTGNTATMGGAACDGGVASAGGNVSDATCFAAPRPTDAVSLLATVGLLGDHGGPTDTVLPLAGNPAVDHAGACTGSDQRGVARPQGGGCDSGAVELRSQLSAAGTLALGSALVGEHTAAASTVVTNSGERAVTITDVTLGGPDAAEVESQPDPDACAAAVVIPPGDTCVLNARLSPTSPGAKTATYSVAIAGSTLEVPVTGTGDPRPAKLEVSGPLALGSAVVSQQSPTVSTVVTNAGDLDADITSVTLTGSNAAEVERVADLDDCTDATVLAGGETCVIKARLVPTSVGAKSATFSVAIGGSTLDVPVTGTGNPAPSPPGGGSNPPPNHPQPAPTPSADAVLIGSSTKARKGGKLKLRVRCAVVGATECQGSLTLKLGSRKLKRTFRIAAGKQAVVNLKLGAGDRRRLARKRSLRSAVTVVTTQPDGTRRTTHQGAFKLLRA